LVQDLIIQTDDSYLKIARRLDQIRTNRTESLHICMAKPLQKTDRPEASGSKFYGDSPSERHGFYLDPVRNRRKVLRLTDEGERKLSPIRLFA
uniref:PDZ_6 domain-containing protein n=1 Tax=Gongylonema pulchrum TaxID=637853 RepID=A0A183DMJ3_9BILA